MNRKRYFIGTGKVFLKFWSCKYNITNEKRDCSAVFGKMKTLMEQTKIFRNSPGRKNMIVRACSADLPSKGIKYNKAFRQAMTLDLDTIENQALIAVKNCKPEIIVQVCDLDYHYDKYNSCKSKKKEAQVSKTCALRHT